MEGCAYVRTLRLLCVRTGETVPVRCRHVWRSVCEQTLAVACWSGGCVRLHVTRPKVCVRDTSDSVRGALRCLRRGCVGVMARVCPGYEGITHVHVRGCTRLCLRKWVCAEGGGPVSLLQRGVDTSWNVGHCASQGRGTRVVWYGVCVAWCVCGVYACLVCLCVCMCVCICSAQIKLLPLGKCTGHWASSGLHYWSPNRPHVQRACWGFLLLSSSRTIPVGMSHRHSRPTVLLLPYPTPARMEPRAGLRKLPLGRTADALGPIAPPL